MGWRRVLLWLGYLFLLGAVALLAGEGLLRFMGRKPWRPYLARDMFVEPGGKAFQRSARFGFVHVPGHLTVRFADGYTFETTNLPNGHRITRPLESYGTDREWVCSVWLFGCSLAYGWGVNDDEALGWLIQQALPDCHIVNFSQCGYGQLQMLLQFRDALVREPAPAVAIVTYVSLHDERNALLRRWRKGFFYYNTLGPLRQPEGRVNRAGELDIHFCDPVYRGFPGMRYSALIHTIEEKWDLLGERYWIHPRAVTEAIFREFAALCEEHGIALLVAGLDTDPRTDEVLDYGEKLGATVVNTRLDWLDPKYNLLPHDNHPNAAAQRYLAEQIVPVLDGLLQESGEERVNGAPEAP